MDMTLRTAFMWRNGILYAAMLGMPVPKPRV